MLRLLTVSNKEFNTMYKMIQRLGDALLRPFGLAWHLWPAPSPSNRWLDHEVQAAGDRRALRLWLGSVHMVFDRGR